LMQRGYGKQVDVWSLGVILFILLCGYPPFYDESDAVLFELIMKGRFHFDERYWRDVSDSAKHLIKNMLQVDPVKRYNTYMVLQHPWITGEVEVPRVNLSKSISVNLKKTGLGHVKEEHTVMSDTATTITTNTTVVAPSAAVQHPQVQQHQQNGDDNGSHDSMEVEKTLQQMHVSSQQQHGTSSPRRASPVTTGSPARTNRATKMEHLNRPDARKTMV